MKQMTKTLRSKHRAIAALRVIYLLLLSVLILTGTGRTQTNWPEGVIGGLQHTGALHIYAEKGTLRVDLYKQDLKTNTPVDRTATIFLAGPDGTIHATETLLSPPGQWDGGNGPLQHIRLSAEVSLPGVYTVFITCNNDPYLRKAQVWGFSTNAEQYLINSSAGHQDGRREEPILLFRDTRPISVFFKPVSRDFQVRVDHLPPGAGTIELRDPEDRLVWQSADTAGKASSGNIIAIQQGIWELKLPAARGQVLISKLNHELEPGKPVAPVWTTSRERFFELSEVHWLLEPRRVSRQLKPGSRGSLLFSVYNNSAGAATFHLSVAPDNRFPGTVTTAVPNTRIGPYAIDTVRVDYRLDKNVPEGNYHFNLVAKNITTGYQASSLGELRVSEKDAGAEVSLPIRYHLFEHDQFQFAYNPDYPRDNQFYFDSDNRPWLVTPAGLMTWRNGAWKRIELPGYTAAHLRFHLSTLGTDANGYVYAIGYLKGKPHLVRASSRKLQGDAVALPESGVYSLETSGMSADTRFPPAILRYNRQAKKAVGRWATTHDVELIIPAIKNGKLSLLPSVPVTGNGIGVSQHSGVANTLVSDEDAIHLVWGETSDPAKEDPGVPIYTSTYHRSSAVLSNKTFIAYAPPVNDVHNTSSILMDSRQNRHIITGAHNRPFIHRTAAKGSDHWSAPQQVSGLEQTYVGALPDARNGIHLLYRIWQRGDAFPGLFNTALYYQYKKAEAAAWSDPQPFALPALSAYSIYRHRITKDRQDNLYVSMEYWSTWGAYREMYRHDPKTSPDGRTRLNLISKDNGKTWSILKGADLRDAVDRYRRR